MMPLIQLTQQMLLFLSIKRENKPLKLSILTICNNPVATFSHKVKFNIGMFVIVLYMYLISTLFNYLFTVLCSPRSVVFLHVMSA